MPDPFSVSTSLVPLAVTISDGAVTGIQLGGVASREAQSPLEEQVSRELDEYCRGLRTRFAFRVATNGTVFQETVWQALSRIAFGETRTYGEIAALIGNAGAARAVGMANHHNPIPIVIPCHRVVASGGRLGGYGGGVVLKRKLLHLEAAHAPILDGTPR